MTADGAKLSPRHSFEVWQETLSSRSLSWHPEEIEALEGLRQSIIEIDLGRQVSAALSSNEELDQFADIISHDLKEPLRGINAYANFLTEDLSDLPKESAETLRGIIDLSARARKMIEDLHEFSKLGQVDFAFAPVDLRLMVREVISRLKPFLSENVADVVVSPFLPMVPCDRVRVAEVFQNLITNAVKYSDQARRTVEVGVMPQTVPPVFFVRDHGIGIAPQDQVRIFRVFTRLHEPGQYGGGSGHGLSIVKRIVEKHGGKIWVKSEPGQGTTFFFTLSRDRIEEKEGAGT